MKIYIFTLITACLSVLGLAQNPHGTLLTIDCAACHSPEGWEIAKSAWNNGKLVNPYTEDAFDHAQTDFPLTGQHASQNCISCHESLVFSNTNSECISCHTDLHQMTVGSDCARCHSTENWLVDNVTQLHVDNGFPLLGQHASTSCFECHVSESVQRYDRIGNDCISCHMDDYTSATMPDHKAAGYSLDCLECHDVASPSWEWEAGFANHLFFPLTGGHEINDCAACHSGDVFTGTPTDCFACHEDDYLSTTDPNHQLVGFQTDCDACHSTAPGWEATNFTEHDQKFPIFSGTHKGEWNECVECHTTVGSFTAFSCIDCHEHNDPSRLANDHDGVSDYSYSSQACYSCHPDGKE